MNIPIVRRPTRCIIHKPRSFTDAGILLDATKCNIRYMFMAHT